MMKTVKKICGVCGSKADVNFSFTLRKEGKGGYRVQCNTCGRSTGYYATPKEALEEWDRMFPLLFDTYEDSVYKN